MPTKPPLSPMQQRVYDELVTTEQTTGHLPELSALARKLGIHYVSLRQHLEALATKNRITFTSRGRGRSPLVEIINHDPPGIPLLGEIPAGPLATAEAHIEGYVTAMPPAPELFALRVHGYSMADLIQPGDIVMLRHGQPERSGLICAVRIGEDEVTLKYVDSKPDHYYELRPHNPDYETVTVHGSELTIDGVYRGLIRGDFTSELLALN